MRNNTFKALHLGGLLDLPRHRLLAVWAADCAEHVLLLFNMAHPHDDRPQRAIEAARAWSRGEITVGQARAASIGAHAAAREGIDTAAQYAARAAGHAAAVAHMADHAPRAAAYAVRSVRAAGNAGGDDGLTITDSERKWQQERVPEEIRRLLIFL